MAEINQFLSSDAEKQVKDLVKLMGDLAKSYEQAFKSSKKLDEQITKTSKTTEKEKDKKKELTAIQKEEARILKATETTKAKLQTIATASNKLLTKEQELLKAKNKELRAEVTETGKLEGAFRKLNQRRADAAKRLKDLVASERASTREIQRAQKAFDGLDRKVQKANRSARQFQSNVGNYPQLLRASTSALKGFIGAFGLFGGIALFAVAVRDAFRVIREFDKQIIAVQKTTNLTNPEIKLFKKEVIELGLALKGVSIQGLLKAAEIAGQLGVKGRKNILKFSEVIEKLKLTSDIAGEEAVRNFAKFIEISTDTVANADRLGSVITELGNNFATSESQILKNTIEIQKGIAIYDANAASVIGLGAATNALGSEAEQARSALQTTFKVLNDGASSGKNLSKILKLTGQTAAEFREEFGINSVKVFQRFVKGLSESVEEGKNLSNTLSDLGLEQKRTEAVIGVLAKNYNVLEDALERANTEYVNNIALNKEAGLSAQSLDSIIGDLTDSWAGLIVAIEDGDGIISKFIKGSLAFISEGLEGLALLINNTDVEFEKWKKTIEGDDLSLTQITGTIGRLESQIAGLNEAMDSGALFKDKSKSDQIAALRDARSRIERFNKEVAFLEELQKVKQAEADEELKRLADIEKEKERIRQLALEVEIEKRRKANAKLLAEHSLLKLQKRLLDEQEAEDLDRMIEAELQAEKDLNDQLLKINKNRLEQEAKDEEDHLKHLANLFQGFQKGETETAEDFERKKAEEREKIAQSALEFINDAAQRFSDLKIQQLSDESNALELQRQTQLEAVKGDKEKEAQVNAEFDKKQAVIKQKQWKAEQNAAITQIIIQGLLGAAKTVGNLGLPFAIPFLIAQAALVIGQIALVKSVKPPKFGKGSKGLPKDTYGEVGDAGRELLFMPGGGVALAEKSTKTMLPKGTVIKTNRETEQILAANQLRASRENDVAMRDYSELTLLGNSIAEDRKSILKAISDQDRYYFKMSKEGIEAFMENSRGRTGYLDTRFR